MLYGAFQGHEHMSTKSQWRGGAGGAPILSQPIARVGQFPFPGGGSGKASWWDGIVAVPVLLVAIPIVLMMKLMGKVK